jgi:NCAIR mutase (PurE)-related protein
VNERRLRRLLKQHREGSVSEQQALDALKDLPFEDLGHSRVDHHRELRCGLAEVIFGAGKSPEQVLDITAALRAKGHLVLVTRCSEAIVTALNSTYQDASVHAEAAAVTVGRLPRAKGLVAVISAGTSDRAVAQEAVVTARACGARVESYEDIGVAGLHRLASVRAELEEARVVVAVAGMEGALPSVVAGLLSKPVIAVPTSVGYGASFGGLAALLGMLSSCASGVSVVNIDNGFGAGYQAALINRR